MDHKEAVQTMAAERYLLNEFGPEEKDAFEEHIFSCDACVQDIKAGAILLEHGKEIFTQEREQAFAGRGASIQLRPKRDWFAWLRPAFAVPAMALLLGVVVFQNIVQFPAMRQSIEALNAPALLPTPLYLASGSARGDDHVLTAKPGQAFVLQIDIPGEGRAAYTAELYDAAGQKKWSLSIPEDSPKEGLSLKMPGDLPAGSYSLVVKPGGGAASSEVSRYTFGLQRQ